MKAYVVLLVFGLTLSGCGSGAPSDNSGQSPASDAGALGAQTLDACPDSVPWDQAHSYIGEQISVEGPVTGTVYASESRGKPTFLNIGMDYPDPARFVIVIWGYDRDNFSFAPEVTYESKRICVTGVVEMYKGVPEIIADSASDIVIVD